MRDTLGVDRDLGPVGRVRRAGRAYRFGLSRPARGATGAATMKPRPPSASSTQRRSSRSACLAALLAVPLLTSAPRGPAASPAAPCPTDPEAAEDLHCIELLPAAGVPDVEGLVELLPAPSPFGIAVSRTGALRRRVVLHAGELPPPSSLGPYRAYVAWATTPRLDPMIRLGEVEEGRNELGTVALNRFLVLVTAEERPDAERRGGRLVLRGASPSLRLHPHEYAAYLGTAVADREGDREGDGDPWPRSPTMPPGVQPMPGLGALRPGVAPLLPDGDPSDLPPVRRTRTVELSDGDTLRLEAGPVRFRMGRTEFVGLAYNGSIPGPLIRVPRAAEVTVLFRNGLDMPTTIHWHGLRLDNAFDGVPGVTQAPVEPGERFTYRIHFEDAGLYWYHPHVREDAQQDLGLYGNMLVEPRPPGTPRSEAAELLENPAGDGYTYGGHFGPVNREEVVMLDDLLLAGDRPVPYGRERATHALMGRFGNRFLVNGEPRYDLEVTEGEVVRFWITNVASTRTFNLSFGDRPAKVVASDLSRFRRPVRSPNVVLGPAERYAVEVRFDEAGTVPLVNRVQALDHVYGNFFPEVDTLGTVRDRVLHLGMEAEGLPFPVDGLMRKDSIYFHPVEMSGTMPRMNWVSTTGEVRWILRDPATGAENMGIDWRFRVGDVVRLRLRNLRHAAHAMQHPIHIHGQRFLVLARDGVPTDNLAWKDTVLVPVGSTVDLMLELSNPGDWMIHCHIAEHLESGMRMVFTVDPADDAAGSEP